MDKTIEELKACPFCKKPAEVSQDRFGWWFPSCTGDDCPGINSEQDEQGGTDCSCRTREEAVTLWNTRADGLTELEREVVDAAVEKDESQRALTRFSSGDHVPVLERETRARERYVKVLDALIEARAKQEPTE